MNDESFCAACQDNVLSQIYCAGFSAEYESFFWKVFFTCFIFQYCSISSSVAVFGAICCFGYFILQRINIFWII